MSMWLITLESLVKDVWINYRHNRDRVGDLILYHLGVVHYRGLTSGGLYKSKFPIGTLSKGHKALHMKEVM